MEWKVLLPGIHLTTEKSIKLKILSQLQENVLFSIREYQGKNISTIYISSSVYTCVYDRIYLKYSTISQM